MVLGNFDAADFLANYWQKKPLVIRQAFEHVDWLEPNDLAGLACEEEVESRIILQDKKKGWQLEHGPFSESRFAKLPEKNWTLLVQGVDQWVPEVADILRYFSFLPAWRLDDIMVSYAPVGGTVSQHFDYFDVFLIQGEGSRTWQIGQVCDAQSAYLPDVPVRILQEFEVKMEFTLEPGDILYIPAKHAHYGVSVEDSLTYSVGFRAPGIREIVDGVTTTALETLTDDQRYQDTVESLQASRGEIPPQAIAIIKNMLMNVINNEQVLSAWLGEYVTERKYPEQQECVDLEGDELARLQAGEPLIKHPASRFAYYEFSSEQVDLFVDGLSYSATAELAGYIANAQTLETHALVELCQKPQNKALLLQLIQAGTLVFEDDY